MNTPKKSQAEKVEPASANEGTFGRHTAAVSMDCVSGYGEKARKTACFRLIRTPTNPFISHCSYKEIADFCGSSGALTYHVAACVFVAMGLRQAMLFERGGGFVNDGIGGGAGRAGIAA
ncbi:MULTISPECIES: hypothetical protein [unclassified Mesorhizobium]|uniref:hypothetical protein n=1 Tax=unclassified Mesorhizobium TaxID=325217 RepID=UPI001CC98540|nr:MULTISPECIES: hypothetical protein [unclassified Mesorhizobium]MBZ9740478.1 hypothetical protein [Mesorhizobium sp. CO1-1-4]MBZ9800471.1 hypothetical protein [Mesorhizobium sp. ES1-6]